MEAEVLTRELVFSHVCRTPGIHERRAAFSTVTPGYSLRTRIDDPFVRSSDRERTKPLFTLRVHEIYVNGNLSGRSRNFLSQNCYASFVAMHACNTTRGLVERISAQASGARYLFKGPLQSLEAIVVSCSTTPP
jgi:hypothetical protein